MGLTRLAINRPIAILMFFFALIALGGVAFSRLKVDRFPALSFPFVGVSVSYPGASAEDVEELVVKVLEDAVAGAPNVLSVNSTSADGFGSVNVQLAEGADANVAAVDIERRVASARGRLPADVNPPSIFKADPQSFPILNVSFSGRRSLEELYDLGNDQVLPRLLGVPGVATVNLFGGLAREVQIKADPQKLAGFGLSTASITQALQRENISSPGGAAADNGVSTNIRTAGLFRNADQLRNLIISQGPNGVVRLSQVAEVTEAVKDRTRIQRYSQRGEDGRPVSRESIGFSIVKQSDANAVQVADAVKSQLGRIRAQLPPDVTFTVTNDTTRFTRASVEAVEFDLGLAIAITALVLLLFLHGIRSFAIGLIAIPLSFGAAYGLRLLTGTALDGLPWQTLLLIVGLIIGIVLLIALRAFSALIVLCAIPVSIIATLLFMFVMGFTLNTISLLALALMIGILVDDSIVVLENIDRHLHMGRTPRDAALVGRSEIGLAAIAITLVDVVVFVPLAFMPGNLGQLFREFGFTIAAATLMSLFVSFTLTPMLASRWLRPLREAPAAGPQTHGESADHGFLAHVSSGYRWLLGGALRVRWLVLLVGVGIFTYSLAMVGAFGNSLATPVGTVPLRVLGSEYAPTDDDNQISLNLEMPPGTTLDITTQAATRVETLLMANYPEIETLFTSIGGGGGGFGGAGGRTASIAVQLTDKHTRQRSVFDILAAIRRDMARAVPGLTVRGSVQNAFAGGGGTPLSIRLTGDDLDVLIQKAGEIAQVAGTVPGVVDMRSSVGNELPELQIVPDRQRLADRGVTVQQVATAVRAALDGTVVSTLRPGNSPQRDIRLFVTGRNKPDPAVLATIPVAVVGGQVVKVGDVAQIVAEKAPLQISRVDRQRLVTLSGGVQGRPVGDVAAEVRQAINTRVQLPSGYRMTFGGQVSQLDSALAALAQVLMLSILLIYMLLAALYESWLQPLAIMFSLPVALIGAFTALWITGNTLNIFSVIGIILLMGLVAKNGILLVDFANTLRERGFALREAVLESGRTRLRPILMTTSTIVCAMIPLALKLEEGAESRAPLAVAILGGVISSLLLTLFLVPSVYTILIDLSQNVGGWFSFPKLRRRPATADGPPAPATSTSSTVIGEPGDDD
ncbi:MAG: efflux RND transporter permease subunit [Chloroflexi bacterium]|nr:efflux RND transporter permease subunit [Chloroflexota bacterium]